MIVKTLVAGLEVLQEERLYVGMLVGAGVAYMYPPATLAMIAVAIGGILGAIGMTAWLARK